MEKLCCQLGRLLILLLDQVISGNQVHLLKIQSNIFPLKRVISFSCHTKSNEKKFTKTKDVASLLEQWKQDCSQSHWILRTLFWIHPGINENKIQGSVPSTKFLKESPKAGDAKLVLNWTTCSLCPGVGL